MSVTPASRVNWTAVTLAYALVWLVNGLLAYSVERDEITLVKRAVKRMLATGDLRSPVAALVGVDDTRGFRAVAAQVELGAKIVTLAAEQAATLDAAVGTTVTVTTLG